MHAADIQVPAFGAFTGPKARGRGDGRVKERGARSVGCAVGKESEREPIVEGYSGLKKISYEDSVSATRFSNGNWCVVGRDGNMTKELLTKERKAHREGSFDS